jgi:hypothetical protein
MMPMHLVVSLGPVISTFYPGYYPLNLLLRVAYLTGLVLRLMVPHLFFLPNLFAGLEFPFASIGALATSITILDLAIVRDHLERVLPLIGTTCHAVSIVPAAWLGLQLLLRFLARHLALLH